MPFTPHIELSDIARKWITTILLIILGIMLIRLAFKIYRALQMPANAKYVAGGGTLPADWSPEPLAKELFKTMDGVSGANSNDTVFGKFNLLNDNQMIAVYNYWNDNFATKPVLWGLMGTWGSLTEAVKAESSYVSFGTNERDVMLANLERLKLK